MFKVEFVPSEQLDGCGTINISYTSLRKTFDFQEWQVYEFYSHYNTLSCRQVMRVINEQTKGFCTDRTFQNQPAEMCTHYR